MTSFSDGLFQKYSKYLLNLFYKSLETCYPLRYLLRLFILFLNSTDYLDMSLNIWPILFTEQAKTAVENIVIKITNILSLRLTGVMSPYPIVVIVTILQQKEKIYRSIQSLSCIYQALSQVQELELPHSPHNPIACQIQAQKCATKIMNDLENKNSKYTNLAKSNTAVYF